MFCVLLHIWQYWVPYCGRKYWIIFFLLWLHYIPQSTMKETVMINSHWTLCMWSKGDLETYATAHDFLYQCFTNPHTFSSKITLWSVRCVKYFLWNTSCNSFMSKSRYFMLVCFIYHFSWGYTVIAGFSGAQSTS